MKAISNQQYRRAMTILFLMVYIAISHSLGFAQQGVYTIITNPGEDASREMRVSWQTDLDNKNCVVEYTKRSDSNWKNAKRIKGGYSITTTWNGIDTRIGTERFTQEITIFKYGATLNKLKPNTEYMYRIISNTTSEIKYFKTAGAKDFSFAWISDYHHYDPLPNRLNRAMDMISSLISINKGIDFVLSTGDDVAYGGSHSYWKDLFTQRHYRDYMWVTTNGNHDNMDMTNKKNTSKFYRDTHNNPQNGYAGQEGVSYWFKYGNVLWIVLNTEDLNNIIQVPKAQAWAAKVIKDNHSKYIFFIQHYQWFRAVNGAYNSSGFTRWSSFFDKWGVDLALAGNEHIYARTLPLYNGEVSTQPSQGTVYIQAPSSDGERGATMEPTLTLNSDKIAKRWTNGGPTIGGSIIRVTQDSIYIGLYDQNGTLHDQALIPAKR